MPPNIIHLEDNPDILNATEFIFLNDNVNLIQVSSLVAFQKALEAHKFILAILDGKFPNTDGGLIAFNLSKAIQLLNEQKSQKRIPRIIINSAEDLPVLESARQDYREPQDVTIVQKGASGGVLLATQIREYMNSLTQSKE